MPSLLKYFENKFFKKKKEFNAKDKVSAKQLLNDYSLLAEIGQEINENLNIIDVIQTVHKKVSKIMPADVFGIGIYNDEYKTLDFWGTYLDNRITRSQDSIYDENNFSSIAYITNRPILIKNLEKEFSKYIKKYSNSYLNSLGGSLIYVPFSSKKKITGVITVRHKKNNSYNHYHVQILKVIGAFAASAIENSQAFQTIEKQKDSLIEIKKDIEEKNRILEIQNQNIFKSINYALRIQQLLMPSKQQYERILKDIFVFFKPKDIVSGDFYFIEKKNSKLYIAVVDCTGHGVPGALLSVIGYNMLSELTSNPELCASEILNLMSKKLFEIETKDETKIIRDSMNIGLCIYDESTHTLNYAGSYHKLIFFQNKQLNMIEADKKPLGINAKDSCFANFTNHYITVETETVFYMFSDGFTDQFDETNNNKYTRKRFIAFLESIFYFEPEEQEARLQEEFERWKGNNVQTDDVLVVGFKIKP